MSDLQMRPGSNRPPYFHVRIKNYFQEGNRGRFEIAMVDEAGEEIVHTQHPVCTLGLALGVWRTNTSPTNPYIPPHLKACQPRLKIEVCLPEPHKGHLIRALRLSEDETWH